MYSKKYRLVLQETGENMQRKIECNKLCYLAYLKPGDRGWFLIELDDGPEFPHRIRTSIVEAVQYHENKVVVTTENSRYVFCQECD